MCQVWMNLQIEIVPDMKDGFILGMGGEREKSRDIPLRSDFKFQAKIPYGTN